jgi:transcriptional regulator with XRE-family HTH domain
MEALEYSRASLGEKLRKARKEAGLTQAELAKRLGKSQALVSSVERGADSAGERYVKAVLEACWLPPDWRAKRTGPAPVGPDDPERSTGPAEL